MKELKTGVTVKTRKKLVIDDYLVDNLFIRNRRNTDDSTIDSPIHIKLNKLWLVKHSRSRLVDGISVGFYAVYHEDELEITDTPIKIEEIGKIDDVYNENYLLLDY